jgi:hypothetical protein
MVRAKFVLSEITDMAWSKVSKRLKFTTQYDQTIPEDVRFCKATPTGEFVMQVDNPAALEQLKLGECYYLDLTPVPPEPKPAT